MRDKYNFDNTSLLCHHDTLIASLNLVFVVDKHTQSFLVAKGLVYKRLTVRCIYRRSASHNRASSQNPKRNLCNFVCECANE